MTIWRAGENRGRLVEGRGQRIGHQPLDRRVGIVSDKTFQRVQIDTAHEREFAGGESGQPLSTAAHHDGIILLELARVVQKFVLSPTSGQRRQHVGFAVDGEFAVPFRIETALSAGRQRISANSIGIVSHDADDAATPHHYAGIIDHFLGNV